MSNFQKKIEKTAKSVDEAISAALEELNVTKDMVDINVIDEGAKGFLGIGARYARVEVTVKDEYVTETEDAENDDASAEESVTEVTDDDVQADADDENVGRKEAVEVTQERVDKAVNFLKDVFEAMNIEIAMNVTVTDGVINIDLSGESMGIVIGKRGDTLDSLQYLASLVLNHDENDYVKLTLDTENYREKRTQSLLQLSNRLAEKVAKSGKKYTLEPMNPYERRVIHSNLQDHESVTTYSIGDDPYRKVVIAPKNPRYSSSRKPYSKSNGGKKPYRRKNSGGYGRGYAHDDE